MPTNFSYPLSLPTSASALAAIEGVTIRPRSAVNMSRSIYNFQQYVQVQQGQMWEGELRLGVMDRATALLWQSFILSLNGMEGTFIAGDPLMAAPRGPAGGTPRVRTASQSGRTLDVYGFSANTLVLFAGDGFSVGSTNGVTRRMHRTLVGLTTNGSGAGVMDIWPGLRESPASGATIYVNSVSCTWRLATNVLEWDLSVPTLCDGITIPMMEAL